MYKMCRGRGQAGFISFSRRQDARLRGAEAAKGGSLAGNPRIKMAKTDSRGSKKAADLSVFSMEGEWTGRGVSSVGSAVGFFGEGGGPCGCLPRGTPGHKKRASRRRLSQYEICPMYNFDTYHLPKGRRRGRLLSGVSGKCEGARARTGLRASGGRKGIGPQRSMEKGYKRRYGKGRKSK